MEYKIKKIEREVKQMEQDKILEKIGDIIKETFPFYISYKLNKNTKFRQGYELEVEYYYMGQKITFITSIPRYRLEVTKKEFERIEIILDGVKDFLLDIRKDLINYHENETQQEFLRKK